MSRKKFNQFVEAVCACAGVDEPSSVLAGGPLEINGVHFGLAHREETSPEFLLVYCDFGEVPLGRAQDACMTLLAANLWLFFGRRPIFAISSQTARVLSVTHYSLDGSEPETVLADMQDLATTVLCWREGFLSGYWEDDVSLQKPVVVEGKRHIH